MLFSFPTGGGTYSSPTGLCPAVLYKGPPSARLPRIRDGTLHRADPSRPPGPRLEGPCCPPVWRTAPPQPGQSLGIAACERRQFIAGGGLLPSTSLFRVALGGCDALQEGQGHAVPLGVSQPAAEEPQLGPSLPEGPLPCGDAEQGGGGPGRSPPGKDTPRSFPPPENPKSSSFPSNLSRSPGPEAYSPKLPPPHSS